MELLDPVKCNKAKVSVADMLKDWPSAMKSLNGELRIVHAQI